MTSSERRDPLASLFAGAGATGMSEERAVARARAALLGAPVAPRVLSRYRLDRTLGSGAMGEVWLAHDPELSRMVAIKLVKDPSGRQVERLAREARSLAQLSHPNVVQIFDVGTYPEHDGTTGVFVVMELELFAAAAHEDLGMPAASLERFRRSYYAAVEAGDGRLAMQAAMRVAVAMAEQGDHEGAATWLGHADAGRARASLSRHDQAMRDGQLAMIEALRGDLETSAATMQRAIDACANGGCPRTYVASLTNLVQLHLRAGAADRAVELAQQAVAASATTGGAIDGALARIELASALSLQQHHEEALAELDIAMAILEHLSAGGSPLAARASFAASRALGALGRGPEAVAAAERAWALVQTQTLPGDPRRESYRASLAAARAEAGDLRGALRDFDELLAEESSDLVNRAAVLVTRGEIREQAGDTDGAIADARAARASTLEVAPGRTDWITLTYRNELSAVHLRSGCAAAVAITDDMLAWVDAHGTAADRTSLRTKVAELATACGGTR